MCTPPFSRSTRSDREVLSGRSANNQTSRSSPRVGKKDKLASKYRNAQQRTFSLPTFVIVLVAAVLLCFRAGKLSRVYFQQQGMLGWCNSKIAQAKHSSSLPIHQENWDSDSHKAVIEQSYNTSDCGIDTGADEDGVCKASSGVKRYARHLVADIQHVERSFLNSQERLVEAMKTLATLSRTMIVSHYCFSMQPMGVSCAGEFDEAGHATLHTWPKEGVIAIDFITFSRRTDLPHPEEVKKIFGPPQGSVDPEIFWFIRPRGQPSSEISNTNDLFYLFGDQTVSKTDVVSVQTQFQKIDIYDVTGNPNNAIPMSKKISKRLPDREPTERIVYLDGVMQSRQFGEVAYHEALVQPALLLHRNPKRVAIIGGGEGGTLREVLKHKTLEKVVMIDIDEQMVNVSRAYIPQWSDCSNIVASSHASCFDDPRAEVYFEDAVAWFISRFGDHSQIPVNAKFDVIIMDALDPSDDVEFSDFLYKNDDLLHAFSNALGTDGILVAQVGQGASLRSQPESYREDNQRAEFIRAVEHSGFENILTYEESHGRFTLPWSFLVAMKDGSDRSRWYAEAADWELEIKKRILSTKNGEPALNFFDSATMMGYQYPTRVAELIWCLDKPDDCEDTKPRFDPGILDVPVSSFTIRQSALPNSGRGVFADEFIPGGSYLGARDCVHGMFVPSETLRLIDGMEQTMKEHEYWQCLAFYIDGYGWTEDFYTQPAAGVDPGILTFMNHGCNGSYNNGVSLPFTETSFTDETEPLLYSAYVDGYNPYYERRYSYPDCSSSVALRDVHAGEEMLCNYLVFEGSFDSEEGREKLETMRRLCAGDQIGRVTDYENRKQHSDLH